MSTPTFSARDVTKTYRMGDVEVAAVKEVDGMEVLSARKIPTGSS